MTEILRIENLSKQYDKKVVLDSINLSVEGGKTAAIIGSSGSGKSTLLRIICGLENPDSGNVVCDKNKLGMIFQDFNLFPHLSVERNVTLALRNVKKASPKIAAETAVHALELVGLADAKNKYPCQLSGGMKQRAAIARALALEPNILCFDEPTSALDPELTAEVLNVIKDLKGSGYTQIIVTHEIGFAKQVADKVVFIDDGKITETGTAEILKNPQTKRLQEFLKSLAKD